LKEKYTLEEAFLIWEVIAVNKMNEFLAMQAAKKENKRK
jgi:hypothetical protein